jgi:hypothetical protein
VGAELGSSGGVGVGVLPPEAVGFAEGELPPLPPWGGDHFLAPSAACPGCDKAAFLVASSLRGVGAMVTSA